MRHVLAGLVTGTLFGAGLGLSGMTDPAVVLGFLDVAGAWNPALAFVMAAALAVTFIGYRLAWRGATPLWAPAFQLPTATQLDAPLLAGAALFGVGWGIAGWCPGPAFASLSAATGPLFAFLLAMLAGMTTIRVVRSGQGTAARPAVTR